MVVVEPRVQYDRGRQRGVPLQAPWRRFTLLVSVAAKRDFGCLPSLPRLEGDSFWEGLADLGAILIIHYHMLDVARIGVDFVVDLRHG